MRVKTDLGGCGTGHVHAAVQELLRFRHVVVLGRIAQLRGEGDHDITMRERRCGREESRHAGMVAQRMDSQGQSTRGKAQLDVPELAHLLLILSLSYLLAELDFVVSLLELLDLSDELLAVLRVLILL